MFCCGAVCDAFTFCFSFKVDLDVMSLCCPPGREAVRGGQQGGDGEQEEEKNNASKSTQGELKEASQLRLLKTRKSWKEAWPC